MRHYKRKYFSKRIVRYCLPPSKLCYRVRAVFAIFGKKIDTTTCKILFNKDAWIKSKNILNETLEGYYSDPPGTSLYRCELNKIKTIKKR